MKIRNGFVSNSSSSSFIVIGKDKNFNYSDFLYDMHNGEYEFGWGPDRLCDITSRINWVMLLARNEDHFNIIDSVLNEILEEKQYIESFSFFKDRILNYDRKISDGDVWDYAYIDHQSDYDMEGLFKDKEKMKDFIFNDDSYIRLDNDNY